MKKMNYGGMKMKTGGMVNPNAKAVATKVSSGKSSGGVNSKANAMAQKLSKGKSSGGVNKPVPTPKRSSK